jgi:peptide/nickel transport system ATP-binding protein
LLELINIDKKYNSGLLIKKKRVVLKNINMELGRGGFLGITGESGSGKTTMARIALRLVNPTRGSVIMDNLDITRFSAREMRPLRKKIQIVFQHPEGALNPEYRIIDSLKEAIRIADQPWRSMKDALYDTCAMVNIPPDLLDRYPSQVSGGEIQRVALARALVFKPDYLFLDEPTSMLDLSAQAFILTLIKKISVKNNMGVALITHDLDIIRSLCREIMIIENGERVAYGLIDDVFNGESEQAAKLVRNWELQKNINGDLLCQPGQ